METAEFHAYEPQTLNCDYIMIIIILLLLILLCTTI